MKTTDEMGVQDLEALLAGTNVDPDFDEVETDALPTNQEALVDEGAFEKLNEKPPLVKTPLVRIAAGSIISLLVLAPLFLMFRGNLSVENPSESLVEDASDDIEPFSEEGDELAALKAENAKLKRDMGLASQSLNQSELDALAADQRDTADQSPTASGATAPDSQPAPPTPVASARTVPSSSPSSAVSYRAPAPRTAPTPIRSQPVAQAPAPRTAPTPIRAQPVTQAFAAVNPEPVDPYEMRDRLSSLGSYGQPVATRPTAEPVTVASKSLVTIPAEYSQETVSKAQTVDYRRSPILSVANDEQYYEDAAAVLGLPVQEVINESRPVGAPGILPGETFKAKLINGISWSEGDRPELALETTEDFTIEGADRVLIPAGTRILATINSIDEAGSVRFDITEIFMDAPLNIPPGSLVIQSEDGSIVRASNSGQRGRGSSDLVQTMWGSALNILGNVIESDDSLAGDVAGGVGETVLENQRDRVDAQADQRSAVANSQASIWELQPRDLQIFVSRYIPLEASYED